MDKIWTTAKVDLEDLVVQMADVIDHEGLLEFIKELDLRVGEWDFTILVRDFFNGIDYPGED